MATIVSDKAEVRLTAGVTRDSSGGKQLYDSGLFYDSGLYYDRWGSSPIQGEIASVSLQKERV